MAIPRFRAMGAILISAVLLPPVCGADDCSVPRVQRAQTQVNSCVNSIQALGKTPKTSSPNAELFIAKKLVLQEKLFRLEAGFHDAAAQCLTCFTAPNDGTVAGLGVIADFNKIPDAVYRVGFYEVLEDLKTLDRPTPDALDLRQDAEKQESVYDKMLGTGGTFDLPCANPMKKPDIAMPSADSLSALAIATDSLTHLKTIEPQTGGSSPSAPAPSQNAPTSDQPR